MLGKAGIPLWRPFVVLAKTKAGEDEHEVESLCELQDWVVVEAESVVTESHSWGPEVEGDLANVCSKYCMRRQS